MKTRSKVAALMLVGLFTLGAWDRVRGNTMQDVMRRTKSAFLAGVGPSRCGEPVVRTLSFAEEHTTHYGGRYPSGERVVQRVGRWLSKGRARPDVTLRPTNYAVEVISFPDGGSGCYDNLFVPTELVFDPGLGRPFAVPVVVRVTQRHFGTSWIPFIGPEILGLKPDDALPCPRMRGTVELDGWVPPADPSRARMRARFHDEADDPIGSVWARPLRAVPRCDRSRCVVPAVQPGRVGRPPGRAGSLRDRVTRRDARPR